MINQHIIQIEIGNGKFRKINLKKRSYLHRMEIIDPYSDSMSKNNFDTITLPDLVLLDYEPNGIINDNRITYDEILAIIQLYGYERFDIWAECESETGEADIDPVSLSIKYQENIFGNPMSGGKIVGIYSWHRNLVI